MNRPSPRGAQAGAMKASPWTAGWATASGWLLEASMSSTSMVASGQAKGTARVGGGTRNWLMASCLPSGDQAGSCNQVSPAAALVALLVAGEMTRGGLLAWCSQMLPLERSARRPGGSSVVPDAFPNAGVWASRRRGGQAAASTAAPVSHRRRVLGRIVRAICARIAQCPGPVAAAGVHSVRHFRVCLLIRV